MCTVHCTLLYIRQHQLSSGISGFPAVRPADRTGDTAGRIPYRFLHTCSPCKYIIAVCKNVLAMCKNLGSYWWYCYGRIFYRFLQITSIIGKALIFLCISLPAVYFKYKYCDKVEKSSIPATFLSLFLLVLMFQSTLWLVCTLWHINICACVHCAHSDLTVRLSRLAAILSLLIWSMASLSASPSFSSSPSPNRWFIRHTTYG